MYECWEYLQVAFALGVAVDSRGRATEVASVEVHSATDKTTGFRWANFGPLLNELGKERWELTGVVETAGVVNLFFKRRALPVTANGEQASA